MLVEAVATAAAERHWRESGAASALAAKGMFMAIYRRRWSQLVAQAGAHLLIERIFLVTGDAPPPPAAGAGGFDPADHADIAAAAAYLLGGLPRGQPRG